MTMLVYFVLLLAMGWGFFEAIFLDSSTYEMDHGHGTAKDTFFPLLILYQVLFYDVAGLGIFGANYARAEGDWQPAAMLLASAVYAILFNVLLLLFYERYLHARYPGGDRGFGRSNYTRGKYALILALGTSSILTLIAGAIWRAFTLR
jgi:hypothetical protein